MYHCLIPYLGMFPFYASLTKNPSLGPSCIFPTSPGIMTEPVMWTSLLVQVFWGSTPEPNRTVERASVAHHTWGVWGVGLAGCGDDCGIPFGDQGPRVGMICPRFFQAEKNLGNDPPILRSSERYHLWRISSENVWDKFVTLELNQFQLC